MSAHYSVPRSPTTIYRLLGIGSLLLCGISVPNPAIAQSITPANDGVGTVVTPNGRQFDITGGTLASDGQNAFHSFEQFGLTPNQIANFVANPEVLNILSRVVGGDPSVINGQLTITGADANLFLVNPAGVFFGENAQLNVPASFTATTATGIGFENGWFDVLDANTNDYRALVGNPDQFVFKTDSPGTVFNAGDLSVGQGQTLSLIGGQVTSVGDVSGEQVLLAAVPGQSMVSIRPSGHVLELEIDPLDAMSVNGEINGDSIEALGEWTLPVASLPDVLTGGTLDHASTVIVNPDGTVALSSGAPISTDPDSVTVAATIDVSSNTGVGGTAAIAAGELYLLDANIDANGLMGGGRVQLGGNQQGAGSFPQSDRTYLSSNTAITANALDSGNGGQVIVYSDGSTGFFGDIRAQGGNGSGDGGFVEISGRQQLTFQGQVDTGAVNGAVGTVLLDPENIAIVAGTRDPQVDGESSFNGTINATDPATDDDGLTTTLFESDLERIEGNILLEASNDIKIVSLEDNQLNVFFDIAFRADADNDNQGDFSMNSTDRIVTNGNNLTVEAANITLGTVDTSFVEGDGGDIQLLASGDVIGQALITTNGSFGDSGSVLVGANGNATFSQIDTGVNTGNAGSVDVDAVGDVQIGEPGVSDFAPINTSSAFGAGGDVAITGDRVRIIGTNGEGHSITTDGEGVVSTGDGEIIIIDGEQEGPISGFNNLSGSVNITHGGGPDNIDFIIGDTRGTAATDGVVNGTSGAISTGTTFEFTEPIDQEISIPVGTDLVVEPQQQFPVVTDDPGVLATGSDLVTITSINSAPELTGTVVAETVEETPVLISLASPTVTDADNDNTFLEVANITDGSVLTLNGDPLAVGDVITADDQIVYTPAPGVTGNVEVFQVVASDRVSPSTPITVTATITAAPITVTPSPTPTPVSPSPTPNPVPTTPTPSPTPDPGPTTSVGSPPNRPDEPDTPDTIVGSGNSPSPSPPPGEGPDTGVLPPGLPDNPPPNELVPDRLRPAITTLVSKEVEAPIEIPPLPPVEFYTVNTMNSVENSTHLAKLEQSWSNDFVSYLALESSEPELTGPESAQQLAYEIEEATGERPGFIYASFLPAQLDQQLVLDDHEPHGSDELELVVITARGGMIRRRVPGITRNQVTRIAQDFRRDITLPTRNSTRHLTEAHQLYRWLVAPVQDQLDLHGVTNLSFLADEGLRTIPFAALYDGSSYLVENYSVGLIPSLSLTNTEYVDVRDADMLAMGVSESTNGQTPLPAVPTELSTLIFDVWQGELFLNESATIDTLKDVRQRTPFGIIHMATHAQFREGGYDNSYIQLWDDQLNMDEVRQLGWNDPAVEMLVLSACQTAVGSREAELGFAGLAIQTGVKTAIASLWTVDDTATMSLMTQFYNTLNIAPIKSEALRQAQLSLVRGDVYVEEGVLFIEGLDQGIHLPEESLSTATPDLAHPYFWSAFTTVGNPW